MTVTDLGTERLRRRPPARFGYVERREEAIEGIAELLAATEGQLFLDAGAVRPLLELAQASLEYRRILKPKAGVR